MTMVLIPMGCTDYAGVTDAGEDGKPDADADAGAGSDQGGDKGGDIGGDDGSGLEPECASAEDCTLYSDCCSCLALAPGEEPPPCDMPECFADHCTSIGIDFNSAPQCNAGRCILGFDCDYTQVMCAAPTPVCAPGEIARVRGNCWDGTCVPTSECAYVPACSDCDPAFYACVNYVSMLPTHHCVEAPVACQNDVSCDCMGQSVCVYPFYECSDSPTPNQIDCDCPICQ